MKTNNREVYYVQNPALAATIIWRFCCGYYEGKNEEIKKPVPFPLLFIVLAVIFRDDFCELINGTYKKSGLSKFCEKLFQDKKNDELYTVNNTAIVLRSLTLEAIEIAVACNLIVIDTETALVYPLTNKTQTFSDVIKKILSASEKLGIWCSAVSLMEVGKWLKVRF